MKLSIPLAIQFVIDDVGWWSGDDDSATQGPYRTGFVRDHHPADYQAIVDLGHALGMRPQAAMILSEWDRDNSVAGLPSASREGADWDNNKWRGPWLEEAADIIRNNEDHFEITLHGIGHEFWMNGSFTRGEWYDEAGGLRAVADIGQRLDLFGKILDDNKLGSFPESYVPTAFVHILSPEQESLIPFLNSRGIKYISTPFYRMLNAEKAQAKYFGVDEGLITVDRGQDIFSWQAFGEKPAGMISGPVCGVHWPNILHADPERNSEIVDHWVNFLKPYDESFDNMLAKNTRQMITQLVYREYTQVTLQSQKLLLDFNKVMSAGVTGMDEYFNIKIEAPANSQFIAEGMSILSQSREEGSTYYQLQLKPQQQTAVLKWQSN